MRKDYRKALQHYQRVTQLNHGYADIHNNMGVIYYLKKDYKNALKQFETAMELLPDNREIGHRVERLRKLVKDSQDR